MVETYRTHCVYIKIRSVCMDKALNQRNYLLDITRLVAIIAVIMLHCSAYFVAFFPLGSREFIIGSIFNSISRIGVPLFVMISGALFLDEHKEVTLKKLFLKNIKSLAIISVIWAVFYSVIYQIVLPILGNEPVDAKAFLGAIVFGHTHMWYLYMIIGLYIITPFLRTFAKGENKGLVLLFIGISFCVNFCEPVIDAISKIGPDLSFVNSWIGKFRLDFFGGYTAYYLAGWYIVHVGIKQRWAGVIVYFLGVISLLLTVVFVNLTGDYNNAHQNIGVPVFLYAISAFVALNNIHMQFTEKNAKILTQMSKLSFGTYMIHMLVLTVFNKCFPYNNNCLEYIAMSFLAVTCVSFFISYILSKIPVLKIIVRQ